MAEGLAGQYLIGASMNVINLQAYNNETFLFAQAIPDFATIFPVAQGILRMQMRLTADSTAVLYEWSTSNGGIVWDDTNKLLIAKATVSNIAGFRGVFSYDCRFELGATDALAFGGTLTFLQGITR